MARFHSGKWNGTHYEVIPLNRKFKIKIPKWFSKEKVSSIWTYPYFVDDNIKFAIRVKRREAQSKRRLSECTLYETFPQAPMGNIVSRPIEEFNVNWDNEFSALNETKFHMPGRVYYHLGELNTDDCVMLINADIESDDEWLLKLFWVIFGILMTALGILLGKII